MTADAPMGPVPPYVSFRTLLTQIERMEGEGVPRTIDKYFLQNMAGGTQNHFRHAMRSLGFISDADRSTDVLHALVANPGERKERFAAIMRDRFPALVDLDANASKSDFLEVLSAYNMNSADTQRKALAFFVAACEYAGIPVSPHVKSGRAPSSSPRKAGARSKGKTATTPPVPPPAASMSDDAMKSAYFKLLAKKAEEADDATDLFDRIERLVGITPTLITDPPAAPSTQDGGGR